MIHTSLTRLDPFSLIDDVFQHVRTPLTSQAGKPAGYVPAADARREDNDLIIAVDLPGIDPDNDVSVELTNGGGTLTVSGERKHHHEAEGLREVRYGRFSRSLNLPEKVSQEVVSADYEAGVLTVRVAGIYAEEQPRKIQITSGQEAKALDA